MESDMASRVSFTAIYEPVENGWVQARIRELPGVITAAPSLDEAKELLADALREYLLSLQEDRQPSEVGPPPSAVTERGSLDVVIEAA
jgi:predicted RNase H-like HicB family nuclease